MKHNGKPALEESSPPASVPDSPPEIQEAPHDLASAAKAAVVRRQRRGKVARLPKEVRTRINHMLEDGYSYRQILTELGDLAKDLDEDHIRRWKGGGYQDYLREQLLLEKCRVRGESAFALLASPNPINSFQAAQQIATAQICETMADLGPDVLREALTANPLNYFRMLNCVSRLTTGGLKCERHLVEEAERAASAEKEAVPDSEKGISPKSMKEMEDRLNLM